MSAIIETSKGDLVVDLYVDDCPKAAANFLKLCKMKYYNNCLFYNVQRNYIAQSGDPTNTGKGGESLWGVLYGEQARTQSMMGRALGMGRFFEDEIRPTLKHKKRGLLGMASAGPNLNGSQFYITTGDELPSLDDKHTIFGEVAEGFDVLDAINDTPCDNDGRPLQNVRIRHTIVLDDPTPDPPGLHDHIPDASPAPQFANDGRLEDDWVPDEETRDPEEIEQANREKEAHNRAVVLEMIGDLPEADAQPPSNMLFICKLNPVTTEEDLDIIFSRFGNITSCDIIRDWKTGESLNYAFIGFDSEDACEQAYFKMNNVLIDDRRIKVDFSQSVSHLWKQFKRFGRKGNADLQSEADMHMRQQAEAQKFQLKERYMPMGAGQGGGHGGRGGGGGGYSLVLEGDEPVPVARPPRQQQQEDENRRPHSSSKDLPGGSIRRQRSRSRGRSKQERSRSRGRSKQERSRSRERGKRERSSSREHVKREGRRTRSREQHGGRRDQSRSKERSNREARRNQSRDRRGGSSKRVRSCSRDRTGRKH